MEKNIFRAYPVWAFIAIVVAAGFMLAYQGVSASGSDGTSAWVKIEGQEKKSGVTDGQIVGPIERVDGECQSPQG